MNRKLKIKLVLIVLGWIGILLAAGLAAPKFISQTSFIGSRNHFDERLPKWLYDGRLPRWIWMWASLDGNHYLSIARDGYYGLEYGFFPLYPILIRFLNSLTGLQFVISGLVISYLSFLGMMVMGWKLLRLDYSADRSKSIFYWFLVFPTAFFLISVYNDSLYLFLALSSWYLARKKRIWGGAAVGYFAALTRITGLALLPALAVEMITSRRKVKELLPLILIPLGTLSYFLYLEVFRGGWRLFLSSMAIWGQERFVFPLQTLWRYLNIIFGFQTLDRAYLVASMELSVVILSILLLIKGWKSVRLSYLVYAIVVLLLPSSSGTLAGMPRYFLHAFPLIIILSSLFKHRWLIISFRLVFFVTQLVLFAYFSQGHFVS